jgi:hypothetical protein
MNKPYHHTQIGYVSLVALGAGVLLLIGLILANGFEGVGLVVLLILAVCLVMFATLTVKIDEEALTIRFGPGPIQKRFRLADISSCRVVKNPWYYGWGIHLTPSGWLAQRNVSGFWAVELQMKNGQKYRLGTDDPEGLVQAVQDRL